MLAALGTARRIGLGRLLPRGRERRRTLALALIVARLLEHAQLRGRLGRAAARDVRERLAWERLVETVERAYGMGR